MHIDDFQKARRLADKRTALMDNKASLLAMYVEGVDRTGDPTPMTLTSEDYAHKDCPKRTYIWLDGRAARAIVHTLDTKIGELDVELGNLGIFTYDKEVETSSDG